MKRRLHRGAGIPLILMTGLIPCSESLAVDDKTAHFAISALFGASAETILHYNTDLEDAERVVAGTVLGTIPGLVKEIADSQENDNEFSRGDLLADLAGALTGALLSNLVNNAIQVRVETDSGKQVSLLFSSEF